MPVTLTLIGGYDIHNAPATTPIRKKPTLFILNSEAVVITQKEIAKTMGVIHPGHGNLLGWI